MRNDELESRIVESPDDAANYAVYGDWLLHHGDPRGELIHVQTALESVTGPEFARLKRRERRLFDTYGEAWLGPLASTEEARRSVSWRRGFVDVLDLSLFAEGEFISFLEHPSAALVRDIVGVNVFHRVPPLLSRVRVSGSWPLDWISEAKKLREVDVGMGPTSPLRHPNVKTVRCRNTRSPTHLHALASSELPSLNLVHVQIPVDLIEPLGACIDRLTPATVALGLEPTTDERPYDAEALAAWVHRVRYLCLRTSRMHLAARSPDLRFRHGEDPLVLPIFPEVTELDISFSSGAIFGALPDLPKLESLSFAAGSDEDLEALAECPVAERIQRLSVVVRTAAGARALARRRFSEVRRLELIPARSRTGPLADDESDWRALLDVSVFPKLETLKIASSSRCLRAITTTTLGPRIEDLHITITDGDAGDLLLDLLPRLGVQRVVLSGADRLDPESLARLCALDVPIVWSCERLS